MIEGPCRLLIGIDEAGYGPNLGPLVIACSAWLVRIRNADPDEHLESLLEELQPAFQAKAWRPTSKFVPLGDSKAIHAGPLKPNGLRVGIEYWLSQLMPTAGGVKEILQGLDADFLADESKLAPWYRRISDVSKSNDVEKLSSEAIKSADTAVERVGLKLVGLTAKIVDEASFNIGCEPFGNKAGLLSFESIALARRCLEKTTSADREWMRERRLQSVHIYFDKHGGRNRYQAPLMQVMPEQWFTPVMEGTSRSVYTATWNELPLAVSFVAKGDRLLSSALASMTAKWLREISMDAFNRFWKSHLPHLAPTAGYPVDALRFRNDIEAKATELGLDEPTWWRHR